MHGNSLPDEEFQRRYDAFLQYGSAVKAAEALGLTKDAIFRAKKWAARRGLTSTDPVMDGFRIAKVSNALDESGNVIKSYIQQKPELGPEYDIEDGFKRRASTTQVDGDGRIIQAWYKDAKGEPDAQDVAKIMRDALDGFKGIAKPKPKPKKLLKDSTFFLPISDLHIGACYRSNDPDLCWGSQDTLIDARSAIEEIIEGSPKSQKAIIQGLGDICDFDSLDPVTPKSKHVLETDMAYGEMLEAAQDLMHFTIDLSLKRFGKVHLSMVRGNHDPVTTQAIKSYIKGAYLKEPRVTVDLSDDMHVVHEFYDYMIFCTHTDETKLPAIPGFMASAYREAWGRRRIHLAYGGHTHGAKSEIFDKAGAVCEILPAMIRANRYTRGHGYDSFRGLKGITFTKDGRVKENKVVFQ